VDFTHQVGTHSGATARLLNLTKNWPTTAGASMTINSGRRDHARLWSQAIYDAYPKIQGLWYCSSMDANRPAVALYERAESALPPVPAFHNPLSHPKLKTRFQNSAKRFGYVIL